MEEFTVAYLFYTQALSSKVGCFQQELQCFHVAAKHFNGRLDIAKMELLAL